MKLESPLDKVVPVAVLMLLGGWNDCLLEDTSTIANEIRTISHKTEMKSKRDVMVEMRAVSTHLGYKSHNDFNLITTMNYGLQNLQVLLQFY